jgi:crotonobetainyl-CoA:carnitine CoA-transferase CaiB-like acyl-CoA transferase
MAGPMRDIRVVEIGVWVAGPSAGAILSDWGAEVVKVEPPNGDPYRWIFGVRRPNGEPVLNAAFEYDNRGKRSLALDIESDDGRRIVAQLLERADVFITNMRTKALQRWGLDHETLCAAHPRLVYASVTGYGTEGPEKDRASYDFGGFWARSGIAAALTQAGTPPPAQRGGMGDHTTASALAGGIAAALFERERTGRGQWVSTSLFRAGLFVLGWDTSMALRSFPMPVGYARERAVNPAFNSYQDSEGRWFWLLGLEGDRHWPALVRAVERPDLAEDPRYSSLAVRIQNAGELIALFDGIFASRTLARWAEAFDREDVWWAPVQTTEEVLTDPQAEAAGAFVEAPVPEGTARVLASPVDFSVTPWEVRAPFPELGQHTEEVLLELGYEWEAIIAMKEAGVIP